MKRLLSGSFMLLFLYSVQLNAQCTRSQIISDYNNVYLASAVTDAQLGWTGSLSSCSPGTISSLAQTRTLSRINYFRKLAGLGEVTFDATLASRCQQAALMMAANNSLSHTPPASWQCYTSEGAAAAGNSNLALGAHSSTAISLYMNDYGLSSVGHRRWVLYSRATVFGHGSALRSDALQVFNTPVGPSNPVNIPYPVSGFFPAPLVPTQWSFGKSGADFSAASVHMTGPSGAITLTQLPVENGYGDNTLVWTPLGIITNSTTDVTYNIQISNVKISGVPQTISYSVTICQPVHPPQCPTGKSWSEAECGCMISTLIEEVNTFAGEMTVINPFSDRLEVRLYGFITGEAELTVIDYSGRLVAIRKICIENGENIIFFDSGTWKNGIYFLNLKTSDRKSTSGKIIRQ